MLFGLVQRLESLRTRKVQQAGSVLNLLRVDRHAAKLQ